MKNTRAAFLVLLSVMSLAACSHTVAQAPQDPKRQAEIEEALEGLKDKDASVRHNAVRVLTKLGAQEYAKNIDELLKDKDAGVRGAAVWALGKLGAKEYAKDIVGLLKDNNVVPNEDPNTIHINYYMTTISYEAERVLKEWGVDTEKLKSQNK